MKYSKKTIHRLSRMSGIVPDRRIQNQMNFKSKGLYPTKFPRKNRVCPRLVEKPAHVNKIRVKLSHSESNALVLSQTVVNYYYKNSDIKRAIIKTEYVRVDNYTCKERRMFKRAEERALRNVA